MNHRPRPHALLLSGALLLATASLATAAGATPVNLARSSAGARLTLLASTDQGDTTVRASQALLSDADPLGCALGAGTTTILLSLPQAETIHRLDFLNLTAAGRVAVAVSTLALPAESPRWRSLPAAGRTFGAPDEVVACDLGHVEARYLRITFETQAPGRIDTFGLFGATMAAATTDRPRFVGFGSIGIGGRTGGGNSTGVQVLRVSSGNGSPGEIVDGNLGTGHAFVPGDRRPTTVIDLGSPRTLGGVNIACRTATPGRLDVYAMNRREDADAPLPLAGRQPTGSARVEGRSGLSRVQVTLNAEGVRYLAVVFIPATAAADGKDSKDFNADGNGSRGGTGNNSSNRRTSRAGNQGRSDRGTAGQSSSSDGSDQYGNRPDGRSTADGLDGQSTGGADGQFNTSSGGQSASGSGARSGGAGSDGYSSTGGSGNYAGDGSGNYSSGGSGNNSSGGAGGYSSGGSGNGAGNYSAAGSGGYSSAGTGGGSGSGFGGSGGSFSGGGFGGGGSGGGFGGGFTLAEVGGFGSGGGGAGAFGGGGGGLAGGIGGFGGAFGGGADGFGGFGETGGGSFASNGGFSSGSNGSAFSFTSPSGGGVGNFAGGGGGSPLSLVPSLPPSIRIDLITP